MATISDGCPRIPRKVRSKGKVEAGCTKNTEERGLPEFGAAGESARLVAHVAEEAQTRASTPHTGDTGGMPKDCDDMRNEYSGGTAASGGSPTQPHRTDEQRCRVEDKRRHQKDMMGDGHIRACASSSSRPAVTVRKAHVEIAGSSSCWRWLGMAALLSAIGGAYAVVSAKMPTGVAEYYANLATQWAPCLRRTSRCEATYRHAAAR